MNGITVVSHPFAHLDDDPFEDQDNSEIDEQMKQTEEYKARSYGVNGDVSGEDSMLHVVLRQFLGIDEIEEIETKGSTRTGH